MAFDVVIPSLGESVTEATLGRWLKGEGELVAVDEPILELESDKANMELAAESAGVLHILKPAGETVTAGEIVARIEPVEESSGAAPPAEQTSPAKAETGASERPRPAEPPHPTPTAPPAKQEEEPRLAPAVRRIAEEAGLDLHGARGTGPGGRITKADAEALAAAARAAEAGERGGAARADREEGADARVAPGAAAPGERRVRMSRIRQVIARRLVEAQRTAAILTTFNEADMSAIQSLRARYRDAFRERHGVSLGYLPFFVKACCEAARAVPELNAEIQGDEIVYHSALHMGIAVGTERGLVVPVVRDADRLSFAEVEREIERLAELARSGRIAVDDLSGATFTISNGGVYGSLLSTPILNPPQSGILGMHKIQRRAVVVGEEIAIRPMMYLALSYDHRIVDGKGAVTFLVRVKETLEDPARLLLGL